MRKALKNAGIKEPPPPAVQGCTPACSEAKELVPRIAGALVSTQENLHRALKRFAFILQIEKKSKAQADVEKVVGPKGAGDKDKVLDLVKAVGLYGRWVDELIEASQSFGEKEPTPPPTPPPEVQEQIVVVPGGVDEATLREMLRLKQQQKGFQDEISRLLLVIDELRKRIDAIKTVAASQGPEVAKAVDSVVEEAGLKDIMEPGETTFGGGGTGFGARPQRHAEVIRLKGVFERLYQDSIQRIQRLGLIRERMVLANRAYSAVVDAMVDNRPADDSIPDLSRLNATTSAALRGMWYHTEYLFRHACEYAMGQGIEASLLKGNRPSLGDIMDDDNDDPLAEGREALRDQSTTRQVRRPARLGGDRPLARRTERPGVATGQRGHPLGGQHSSAQAAWSLKRVQTAAPDFAKDSVTTSFATYMSAMKDASSTDGWVSDDRQAATRLRGARPPGLVASEGEKLDVLLATKNGMKIACKSESLPVLPKGRSLLQPSAA